MPNRLSTLLDLVLIIAAHMLSVKLSRVLPHLVDRVNALVVLIRSLF